jgi:prepilin-type N-terminal cleavage/methylation domain-containing protein
MKHSKLRKGFTLVELIVVVAVLALLAVGAALAIRGIQDNARRAANRAAAVHLVTQLNAWNSMADSDDHVVATPPSVEFAGASNNSWVGRVESPVGGDDMFYSAHFPCTCRALQVWGWIEDTSGVWSIDPNADFGDNADSCANPLVPHLINP